MLKRRLQTVQTAADHAGCADHADCADWEFFFKLTYYFSLSFTLRIGLLKVCLHILFYFLLYL